MDTPYWYEHELIKYRQYNENKEYRRWARKSEYSKNKIVRMKFEVGKHWDYMLR